MQTLAERARVYWLPSILLAAVSCSSSPTPPCAPGLQVSCPCAAGGTGVQTCGNDGTAFGSCGPCGVATHDAHTVEDLALGSADLLRTVSADLSSQSAMDLATSSPPDLAFAGDLAQAPICTNPHPTCHVPPGAAGGCCFGTTCDDSTGTVRCCVENNHPCNIDSDCCDTTEVCTHGACTPPPQCAMNGSACGASAPWVTGCCSATAICDQTNIPTRCCQPSGTSCHSDSDCCGALACGANGQCQPPACIPSGNQIDCAIFPGTPCCDARLTCPAVTRSNPNVKCCAPAGTILGSNDSPSLCCAPGVTYLPDGTLECSRP